MCYRDNKRAAELGIPPWGVGLAAFLIMVASALCVLALLAWLLIH